MKDHEEFRTVRGYQLQSHRALTVAMEDYLEMMYRETLKDHPLRISNLAKKLNVNPSSATKMMQRLGQLGIVSYQKYGIIRLSEQGKKLGKHFYDRHLIVQTFLQALIPDKDCLTETELMEHSVSTDTLNALDHMNHFLQQHPDILLKFRAFVERNKD